MTPLICTPSCKKPFLSTYASIKIYRLPLPSVVMKLSRYFLERRDRRRGR